MKYKRFTQCTLFISIISLAVLQAQEVIPATGGNASGSGGLASYSVGQVVYQSYTGTSGSISEGVQQSYEIAVVTAVKETKGINLSVTAYPNPTTDYLTLSINEFDISNLSYQLFDMQGKLLQSEKITGNQTSIVMSNFIPASYLLKIIEGKKEVKTFKIIKH
jgi:hypothetical protein